MDDQIVLMLKAFLLKGGMKAQEAQTTAIANATTARALMANNGTLVALRAFAESLL